MKRCLTPAAKLCSQLADWSTGNATIAAPIVLSTRIFSCWRALPLKSCNCVAINKFSDSLNFGHRTIAFTRMWHCGMEHQMRNLRTFGHPRLSGKAGAWCGQKALEYPAIGQRTHATWGNAPTMRAVLPRIAGKFDARTAAPELNSDAGTE
jgi:hypothetical protein